MTFDILWRISALFGGLFILGTLACLPLYRNSFKALRKSSLWTKIVWWWPIFGVFLVILYGGFVAASIVTLGLLGGAVVEYIRQRGWREIIATSYLVFFCFVTLHLALFWTAFSGEVVVMSLIAICFASVLSDVAAFFLGNYTGKHPLPAWINVRKSWEGVGGQFAGAVIGYGLVSLILAVPFHLAAALVIGVASAAGDLFNSTTKRRLSIKDWGNTIPGHGGLLDRFSSLSTAIAAMYWLVLVT